MDTPTPDFCRECPASKLGDSYSLDGFDRGFDITCGFLKKVVVSFWEHYSDDKEPPKDCPLR